MENPRPTRPARRCRRKSYGYAVSNNFQDNSRVYPLNSDTLGEYTITDLTPRTIATGVIAVVFAAGTALGSQDRSTTTTALCPTTGTTIIRSRCAANYLDNVNGNGTATFTIGFPSFTLNDGIFNDKLLLITRDNFFPSVEQRVARELRQNLQSYYTTNRYYPLAATLTGTTCSTGTYRGRVPTVSCSPLAGLTLPPWITPNNWNEVMVYAVAPRCTPKLDVTGGWSFGPSTCLGGTPWLFGLTICPSYTIDASKLDCTNTAAGSYLTVGTNNSIQSLVLPASYGLTGQTRPCSVASSCLEDPENYEIADNFIYVQPQRSATNNDQLVVVSP